MNEPLALRHKESPKFKAGDLVTLLSDYTCSFIDDEQGGISFIWKAGDVGLILAELQPKEYPLYDVLLYGESHQFASVYLKLV